MRTTPPATADIVEREQPAAPEDDSDFDFMLDFDQDLGGFTPQDLIVELVRAHYAVMLANRAMSGLTFADERCAPARALSDAALLMLTKAKWKAGGVTHAYNGVVRSADPSADAAQARADAREAARIAHALKQALLDGTPLSDIELPSMRLDTEGTECLRVDGIPVVPSICPVVVLEGSSYEMGWQYAQQVLEIYGGFNFELFARLRFSSTRRERLQRWEAQLRAHTPELPDFIHGWSDGATAAGFPMSYDHVLHLWVGAEEPARDLDSGFSPFSPDLRLPVAMYFGQAAVLGERVKPLVPRPADGANPMEACSGICAWAAGTADGRLKTASTTDHDCWMQATIVAYPDTGHSHIYTPFTVTGWQPGMGSTRFAGHPGMNNRGLAYVHHGGEPHMMEPEETWGYGVPRGAATLHSLRFASSAREAVAQQFALPIGDVGTVLGSAGGQWADRSEGFVIESRHRSEAQPGGLVRDGTPDAQGRLQPLLYAGNSSLHPLAKGWNHGYAPGEMSYSVERGWHMPDETKVPVDSVKRTMMRMTSSGQGERVRTYHRHALPAVGRIDLQWLQRLYRTPTVGYPDAANWAEAMAAVRLGERKLLMSPAKRINAFTALMEPDDGDQGLYHACIGPLSRDVPPGGGGHEYSYVDETNAFWTLRLAGTPAELVADAGQRAAADLDRAIQLWQDLPAGHAGRAALKAWLDDASAALAEGRSLAASAGPAAQADAVQARAHFSAWRARTVRRYTRAQVRARQVIQSIDVPTSLVTPD